VSDAFQPNLDFNAEEVEEREAFVVDLDGYEGPLHVLLALARTQKVDLLKLSITQLAEQYLAFVHEARRRNFALAADYLVMASWLAYLKSRLLLPRTEKGKGEEPPAEAMAAALAFRLQKLEAMRKAVRSALDLLHARYGMEEHLAYAYLSAATDFDISQVVDVVCGVHARIREDDFAGVSRHSETDTEGLA